MAATPTEHPSTTSPFPTRQKPIPYTTSNGQRTPLSSILPPLVFGTATFNYQYSNDPFALDTTGLVTSALTHGIRAFDTSPYYGPSEQLLGDALATPFVRETFPRSSYMILTKVGRISIDEFDYSAAWVRQSVARSLERLHTDYLDVVYCHDIEFVSPAEVLEAVRTLRALRDEGKIRYVGISAYPIDVLGDMADLILRETGESVDCAQSYAHFTLQNQSLASARGLPRLQSAGVDVVTNASTLGMGLLRRQGVPIGALGDFHPAPPGLRAAVRDASNFCDQHGERIEVIALRWALETWASVGQSCGSQGDPASGLPWTPESNSDVAGGAKMGVSVIGVSNALELDKTMLVWRSILDGLDGGKETARQAGRWSRAWEWSCNRRKAVCLLAEGVQEILGNVWFGYSWASPEPGFVNRRGKKGRDGAAKEKEDDEVVVVVEEKEYMSPPQSPGSKPVSLHAEEGEKALPIR